MALLPFKYAFFLVVFVIIVLIIRRIRRTPDAIINKLKEEFMKSVDSRDKTILQTGEEIEEKVREFRHNKKLSQKKSKKKARSGFKNSTNKHEERVREIMEDYFDDYFPTCRPKFLKNPKTGKCLELDGYNPRLNLAFEYQGIQHRKFTPRFHTDIADFEYQQYRDRVKRKTLQRLEISLFEIPDQIAYKDLEYYVEDWLKKNGYKKR